MIRFWCADGSDGEEYKEYFIGVEAMQINVYYNSGDKDVLRIDLVII